MTMKPTNQLLAEVEMIMERRDQARLDTEGGYPSEWMTTDTHVIVATSNYKGATGNSLEYQEIEAWVEAHEHWLDDDEDDGGAADEPFNTPVDR